jgi:CHAT domain-containing protein
MPAPGKLMQTLWRLRRDRPELTKAQALQQAQLALMGSALVQAGGTGQRGARGAVLVGSAADDDGQRIAGADHRYAPPDYWAPFTLMGSWL